jgi:hypothetical protein
MTSKVAKNSRGNPKEHLWGAILTFWQNFLKSDLLREENVPVPVLYITLVHYSIQLYPVERGIKRKNSPYGWLNRNKDPDGRGVIETCLYRSRRDQLY